MARRPNRFWAAPRRLRRQIMRAFIAAGRQLTTEDLAAYAYRGPRRHWHYTNVRRARADWGLKPWATRPGKATIWYWQPPTDS
jgi:hypothetical protein